MIEQTVEELTPLVGTRPACRALGVAPATVYRRRRPPQPRPRRRRPVPARALSGSEREAVLAELHSERFVDCSPAQVWATLLDEGRYLASERTMYRLLDANGEVRERRDQLTHPPYAAPELLACRPNEVWSWDISKLKGPAKRTCFYLYVILDGFSRYVVGWTVQHRESAEFAKALIAQACEQQQIARDQLTVHADRGSSMRSKPVAFLLADLGVTRTHSRPYTSTDNPYSEAQFKTLKYRPGFPARFDYTHERYVAPGHRASELLPGVHRIAALTKRWLLGTHQGSVDEAHLPHYLNEFVFRFNRRRSRSRGLVFYRVLELAVDHDPVRYRDLVIDPQPMATPPVPPATRGHPKSLERPPAGRPWRAA